MVMLASIVSVPCICTYGGQRTTTAYITKKRRKEEINSVNHSYIFVTNPGAKGRTVNRC